MSKDTYSSYSIYLLSEIFLLRINKLQIKDLLITLLLLFPSIFVRFLFSLLLCLPFQAEYLIAFVLFLIIKIARFQRSTFYFLLFITTCRCFCSFFLFVIEVFRFHNVCFYKNMHAIHQGNVIVDEISDTSTNNSILISSVSVRHLQMYKLYLIEYST